MGDNSVFKQASNAKGGHCNGEGRYAGKRSYHGSTSATNDIFAFRILVYLK